MALEKPISDRFPKDFRLPGKCRLCLVVHLKDKAALNHSLKHYAKELYEMYGYEVGKDVLWHPESKICRRCASQLEACHRFFRQLAHSVKLLTREANEPEPPKKRKRRNSRKNKTSSNKTETPETKTASNDDIEILEYIEDHTEEPEKVVISDDEEEENVGNSPEKDEDLDFDFTDDEKEEQATVEHEKFVNQILNSEAGIEGEIDCCLIDKRKLAMQEGTVSEEITMVLKDVSDENSKTKIDSKVSQKRKNSGSNVLHDMEYSVCQRCKVIYHRKIDSDSTKCLTCMERMCDIEYRIYLLEKKSSFEGL